MSGDTESEYNNGAHLDSIEDFVHDFKSLVFELHVLYLKRDHVNQQEAQLIVIFMLQCSTEKMSNFFKNINIKLHPHKHRTTLG